MKAIVYTQHGSPDVLRLIDLEKPALEKDQLLIKVHVAALNALDSHMMRGVQGTGWMDRIGKPKPRIPGRDLAGRVEAIGAAVTKFRPGDEVFGVGFGTLAEYSATRERAITLKPSTVSFEAAAAVPVAGLTALQGLRDSGEIKSGQSVLIEGAGGGVGSFAVQIAKAYGCEVTAVCSTRNQEMARSIGADHVIDYTKEDFSLGGKKYDLILAANGYHPLSAYKQVLNPKGILVQAGVSKGYMLKAIGRIFTLAPLMSLTGSRKYRWFLTRGNEKDLLFLAQLLETGKLKPSIDRRYPLSDTADAIRHLEEWHSGGKVIVEVARD